MISWPRVLPHPILSLLLLLLWLLLNNSVAVGQLLLGALLGLFIPMFTRRFWPEPVMLHRPGLILRFIGRVLLDIVVANFVSAKVVLGPRSGIRPLFVRVPLDIAGAFPVTMFANIIALTPGTLTAELDIPRGYLLVHALSEQNPQQLVDLIKRRYEAPIKEIFSC